MFNRAHAIPSGWQASYVSWVLINFEAYSRRKTCGEVNLQAMDQVAYDGTPRCAALKSSYKTSCCSDLSCDITAPRIVDYGPLQGAVGVLPTTDIMLTFNEPIQAGSGSVILVPTYGIPQKIPVQDAQVKCVPAMTALQYDVIADVTLVSALSPFFSQKRAVKFATTGFVLG